MLVSRDSAYIPSRASIGVYYCYVQQNRNVEQARATFSLSLNDRMFMDGLLCYMAVCSSPSGDGVPSLVLFFFNTSFAPSLA